MERVRSIVHHSLAHHTRRCTERGRLLDSSLFVVTAFMRLSGGYSMDRVATSQAGSALCPGSERRRSRGTSVKCRRAVGPPRR